ncbi:hypothetical protein LINGRAHAP2_LOCUS5351 [Linum grandiflorum]
MQLISGDAIAYNYYGGGGGAEHSYNYYSSGEYPHHHYDSAIYHYESRAANYNYYAYEQLPSLTHYAESNPTQSIVLSEFNETDFEEYDSTPYGGGYDLAQTYGNPLPQSDKTCYPRSTAGNMIPSAPVAVAAGPISSAPQVEIRKPIEPKIEESKPKEMEMEEMVELEAVKEEAEVGEYGYGSDGIGYAGRVPSGYGLETVDLCESLFGYWPCLEKSRRESERYGKGGEDYCRGEWNETAADYLFGSSYDPYADGSGWDYRRRDWPVESYHPTYGED